MNPQTDSYHNLLIQGGQDGRDLPTTKTETLEEFEAQIQGLAEDLGMEYSLTFTRENTIVDLFTAWAKSDLGDCLFITITGHEHKTLVIRREDSSRIGQIEDFLVGYTNLNVRASLRSLANTLATRPARLIISAGNAPKHRLHSQPWWGRCLAMKETHSLRELAEEFGATPGALNKALLAFNDNN